MEGVVNTPSKILYYLDPKKKYGTSKLPPNINQQNYNSSEQYSACDLEAYME
jgi:hypothetical protein